MEQYYQFSSQRPVSASRHTSPEPPMAHHPDEYNYYGSHQGGTQQQQLPYMPMSIPSPALTRAQHQLQHYSIQQQQQLQQQQQQQHSPHSPGQTLQQHQAQQQHAQSQLHLGQQLHSPPHSEFQELEDEDLEDEEDDDDEDESSDGGSKKRRKSLKGPASKKIKGESPANSGGKGGGGKDSKPKSTRGSRACTVCRRLKMRCEPTGNDEDVKCKRCKAGNHECVFEESQRGRRKNQKTDLMARSIKNMESTLETVLKSIASGNAHLVAGMTLGDDGMLIPPMESPQPPQTFPPMPQRIPTGPSPTNSSDRLTQMKQEEPIPSPAMRLQSLPEPDNTWAPLGLLAEASLENTHSKNRRNTIEAANTSGEGNEAETSPVRDTNGSTSKLGVANDAYFQPGPFNILPLRQVLIDRAHPSPLLTEKIITIEEAVELFSIYHTQCGQFTAHFLVEDFHTPMNVSARSTFLFTCLCAVASKFYTQRPELYGLCMPHARKLASRIIEQGYKSVEIVQGYMLLAFYNTPTERFEDDRTYTYSGLAIRMAVELNLWRSGDPPEDLDEEGLASFHAEVRNRERTWFQVFIMDRSHANHSGRPYFLRTGEFERHAKAWALSPTSRIPDRGSAAIAEIYLITAKFQDMLRLSCFSPAPGAAMNAADYAIVTKALESELEGWNATWFVDPTDLNRSDAASSSSESREGLMGTSDRHTRYIIAMKVFYLHWHRLLAFSFALQRILKMSSASAFDVLRYFMPCYQSAGQIISVAREQLHAFGYLRYAPDLVFINISYACLFLLKLLRPELADYVDASSIIAQVESGVKVLEEASVDSVHTPALYAGFLRVLLTAKQQPNDGTTRTAGKGEGESSNSSGVTNGQIDPNLNVHNGNGAKPFAEQSQQPQIGIIQSHLGEQFHQHHGTDGMGLGLDGTNNHTINGGFNIDQLGQSGFWENLSMPGLGSPPTYGLSAGHLFQGDPWPFSMPNSAAPSRQGSPRAGATNPSFSIPHMSQI